MDRWVRIDGIHFKSEINNNGQITASIKRMMALYGRITLIRDILSFAFSTFTKEGARGEQLILQKSKREWERKNRELIYM